MFMRKRKLKQSEDFKFSADTIAVKGLSTPILCTAGTHAHFMYLNDVVQFHPSRSLTGTARNAKQRCQKGHFLSTPSLANKTRDILQWHLKNWLTHNLSDCGELGGGRDGDQRGGVGMHWGRGLLNNRCLDKPEAVKNTTTAATNPLPPLNEDHHFALYGTRQGPP